MRRLIVAGVLALVSGATLANQPYRPDVQVNVPPEVFSSSGQRAQPCSQYLSGSKLFRRGSD